MQQIQRKFLKGLLLQVLVPYSALCLPAGLGLVVLLLTKTFSQISSLICETCDGSTCFNKDRWVQELCPPSTQFCYKLSSRELSFRRGCSDYPCATMPGVEEGMECRTCSQDRCNDERDFFFHQRGGGVSWRAKNSKSSVMKFSTSMLLLIVFILYC
uniref:Uncharacterized protein n=1 Tax=Caenorhabditis japonica TaxID=281687 RepID=A0A8R1DQ65_CAEJA